MTHEDSTTQRVESTTLIRTKLNRPRPGGELVPRPRLVTMLECDPQRKLTLVSAPAGYGKTTLLAQWLEGCSCPSAWLSLDEGDNDPGVFLSYFIAAARTAFPEACLTTEMLLRAPQSPPLDHLATVLINELTKLPETLILVLDDFHWIRDPSVHELLNTILRYYPTRYTWLLPPAPIPQWRWIACAPDAERWNDGLRCCQRMWSGNGRVCW